MDLNRVSAIIAKDWLELRGTWAPWLPALLMLPVLALPFVFTLLVPALAGEPLDESVFADQVRALEPFWAPARDLPRRAAVQALVFDQFLVLVVLVAISGAMSLAAHGVIGEKQTRTLEPLLATPLQPVELLLAKVVAALVPALALEVVALVLYVTAIALTAEHGVLASLLSGRSLAIAFALGPAAALAALQLVLLASTRARDPRSAQQVGVFVILPFAGLVVGQSAGAVWLPTTTVLVAALGLAGLWLILLRVTVAAFDGERMLTRWR